jgi:Na+-translocating ferredoxin:NAD+ oxidoreductase subunit D
MDKLIVSPSPHIHGDQSVDKLMFGVVAAMVPALVVSFVFYGFAAMYLTVVSVASCMFFEYVIQKYILKGEPSLKDGSAMVTGILLAFNLPSGLPPFIIILGALVAIGIGKMTFGGLGNNPFNPALVGRVFLLVSFPTRMTKYAVPQGFDSPVLIPKDQLSIDGVTSATPLSIIKEGIQNGENVTALLNEHGITTSKLFLGDIGGSIGEIAAAALLLGLVYMLFKKIITWHIPLSILGSIFVFTGILWLFSAEGSMAMSNTLGFQLPVITFLDDDQVRQSFHMAGPLFHLLTGGVMLGAIFMATDYVTSPMVPKGMIIFGIGIGLITSVIRVFGAYPEGISFAILIMNGFVPLLNRYIKPKRFGVVKQTNK